MNGLFVTYVHICMNVLFITYMHLYMIKLFVTLKLRRANHTALIRYDLKKRIKEEKEIKN